MDAIKSALLNHLEKIKNLIIEGEEGLEGDGQEAAMSEKEEMNQDKAPGSLIGPGGAKEEAMELEQSPDHAKILEAVMGAKGPMGQPGGSLRAKAAEQAKEKFKK